MKKIGLILALFAFTASFTVASTLVATDAVEITLDQDGGKDKKKKKSCSKDKKANCAKADKKACCSKKKTSCSKEKAPAKEEAKETK